MDFITRIISYFESLSDRRQTYAIGIAVFIIAACAGALYYVLHNQSVTIADDITFTYQRERDIATIKKRYSKVQQARKQILEHLSAPFSIKGFLQTFAKKHTLNLKTDYEVTITPLEDSAGFIEISLQVTLEKISTQQLIDTLEDLLSTKQIYVKDMRINKRENYIGVVLTLATLQRSVMGGE